MPRKLRRFEPDWIFHVGARGVDRQPIFLTDADREFFITTMEENLRAANIRTVAYCLMPNHFHWGLAVGNTPFEKPLHDTLTAHAVRFNRLHGRTGHLFEGRHWSEPCEDVEHVENMVAYFHLNPFRAGIVPHPAKWRWSTYAAWSDAAPSLDFARLEELTGRSETSLRQGHAERIAAELAETSRAVDPATLIADTASMLGLSVESLRSGSDERCYRARRTLVRRAVRQGIALHAVAKQLGCTPEALYMIRRRDPNRSA